MLIFIGMEAQLLDKLELAAHFVNTTNSPVFLTGKAGTGKTTFLKNLTGMTHKKHVILAPTGIAALHAKGVTIHSQFLLPLGSFIPSKEPEGNFSDGGNFFTQFTLQRKHPLNSLRKKVLKSIELLIIDEVSMLRADILDAIDYRMKSVKRNFDQPFGGVQVLMIGDLFQLPPIVRDQEWQVLGRFYPSMHFFEAHALRQSGMVYVELDKIFRQSDEQFIRILNNLRNNRPTTEDIRFLNTFFKTEEEIQKLKDHITITTHNYKADEINQRELTRLPGKSYFFEAEIEKDFPENMFPLPKTLELKEGAQVMFIKNDSSGEGIYFNGKMATVTNISAEEIEVRMTDNQFIFKLSKETWENKKYIVNEETKELEEDVIGTFQQFPIKLAWAVTVHKSQGLTFDKAIIDVGQAFAPGQVYVALSRLRSLEGLTLRTKIQTNIIASDPAAVVFTESTSLQAPLPELLSRHQWTYIEKLLIDTFDFQELSFAMSDFIKSNESSREFEDQEMREAIPQLRDIISQERKNTQVFQTQLIALLHQQQEEKLLERLEKGSQYYSQILGSCLQKLLIHRAEVERFSKVKEYLEGISEIDLLLQRKMIEIKKAQKLIPAILHGEEIGKLENVENFMMAKRLQWWGEAREAAAKNPKFSSNKTGKKNKDNKSPSLKRQKGDTQKITFEMSDEGKSISEIAEERGLSESTIKSHLAEGIASGRVLIWKHLNQRTIEEAENLIKKYDGDLGRIKQEEPERMDYGTLKMVQAYLNLSK